MVIVRLLNFMVIFMMLTGIVKVIVKLLMVIFMMLTVIVKMLM